MTGWFAAAPPRVLAHRGLAVDAPENTLLAFARAMGVGVDHLETDVHATSDGVAVISHDPDLRRVRGDDARIAEMPYAQLRRLRLDADQEIPSLAAALDAFPDAFFNIDIKADGALESAVAAIREARAVDRVLVTSFDDRRRRRAVAALPGVATSPGSRGVLAMALASRVHVRAFGGRVLRQVDALQIPETFRGVTILTPSLISMAHAAHVEVHIWTVNDPDDMRRLLVLGVDGLITDRADLAQPVVDALAARGGV